MNWSYKKIQKKFKGNNIKNISSYVYDKVNIVDKDYFIMKLEYFLELFHSLLYYKFIDPVDYTKRKEDIRQTFYDIFKDVEDIL